MAEQSKPILYVVVNNHFDLTWRRCWQRPFTFHGKTFIPYSDLQMYYMLDNLDLARQYPEYKFEAESTQVLRNFLERCPESLGILRQLAREGRFAVTGGGEAIVDSNMITGESLVRNYVDGLLWVEETLGQKTRLAVRNDAFGNSAQLPQILRGCEITWATGMAYSPAGGVYWRGLDGSTVLHARLPTAASGGGNTKYSPCPVCSGNGSSSAGTCPVCGGRGIENTERAWLPRPVDQDALLDYGAGMVWMTPEELLPNPALVDWAEESSAQYDVRFALEEDVLPHLQPWLADLDHPAEDCLHESMELNPNNSGCLVTRIETKQTVRRQEYALQAAETLSVMAALKGKPSPQERLKRTRQAQFYTMFHDAITATHIDPAYQELKDTYRKIDAEIAEEQAEALSCFMRPEVQTGLLSVINLTGHPASSLCSAVVSAPSGQISLSDETGRTIPVVATRMTGDQTAEIRFVAGELPPFGARRYSLCPADSDPNQVDLLSQPVIENGRFRVTGDECGLVSVFDRQLGMEILTADGYRPGELILEHDEGSPWATLSSDQQRIPLSPYTRLIAAEKGQAFQRLVYAVETPREMGLSGKCLRARLTVTLFQGLERVDFQLHGNWDGFNHRLRVAMPVPCQGERRHMYEIPYGMIERQPYSPTFRWAGANGDWPAINWAGVETQQMSVALFNKGTPSYRMEAGDARDGTQRSEVILLSLLRSPSIPAYLHEPEFYSMTDYDGMRDMGEHDFDYAVTAYPGPFARSSVVPDADAYNAGAVTVNGAVSLPAMPELVSGTARISAVKWAEDGTGLIVRLVEFRGQSGDCVLRLPWAVTNAARVNLLERQPEALEVQEQSIRLNLRAWEIATVKLAL